MTVVLVLLFGGALLCLLFVIRSVLWRRLVSVRPVLTVGEAVAAEPGTAVIVHGRTAAFPVEPSPLVGRDCVWYEVLHHRTKVISSNYEETTTTVEVTWGDLAVYDEQGVRMPVTAELGVRPILANLSPLVGEFRPERTTTTSSSDHISISERLVEPGWSVVVTGVVQPDGTLGRGAWPDGSAQPQTPRGLSRQRVQQRGQPRPIDRLEPDPPPVELALQYRELMPQRQDLDVLVTVAARQQPQQRKSVRDAQVRQSQQHEAASSRRHR